MALKTILCCVYLLKKVWESSFYCLCTTQAVAFSKFRFIQRIETGIWKHFKTSNT